MNKALLPLLQITSFTNFFSGDPSIGLNREEVRKKNERIVELEKENKRLRSEAGRSTYSKGRDSARQESAEDKKKRCVCSMTSLSLLNTLPVDLELVLRAHY